MEHYKRTIENYKLLSIEAEELKRKLKLLDQGLTKANIKLSAQDVYGAHGCILKLLEELRDIDFEREEKQDPEETVLEN